MTFSTTTRSPSRRALVALILCALIATLTSLVVWARPATADVTTNSKDALRTGWYPDQPNLSPGLVSGGSFGQQFSAAVNGQVYAQPLVANNTLLVATETNNVYGLDPATGAQRWTVNLGTPWNPADLGCGDLTPAIGITGTPVVDPATNTMYLLSKTYVSGTTGAASWYAHALDISNGVERPNFPVLIGGTATNDPTQTFNATKQMQRPGLLLLGGVIYAAFGAHCDSAPYSGWVAGVSTGGVQTTLWTATSQTGGGAGIWQSGSGLVSDGPGQIILSTGNGKVAAAPTPGITPPAALGEAVVRLAVQNDGSLKATDYFAPYDAASLNGWDADLGSGGPLALPSQYGTASHPNLMVEVGKQGYVYLMDRDNLGGMGQGPSGGDAVLSRIGPDGGVWGKPTAWPGDGGYVYITTASAGSTNYGTAGALHAYKYGVDGTGSPTLSLVGQSSDAFGLSSSPAVVTSDGTNTGTALVWVIYAPTGSGNGAQLRAYNPLPVNGTLQLVNSWPIGVSSKFNPPAVNNNHVYVGTRDGHVLGFGSPISVPMTGSAVTWPATTVGQSSVRTATLTANAALSVTAITTSSPDFVAGASSPALPAALATGETLTVPITFSPAAVGQDSGALQVATSIGSVNLALNGTGQSANAQISANPTAISFGGVSIGRSATGTATFSNTGAQPLTVSSVTMPAAPFSATGMPAAGFVMDPNSSFTATTSFNPTATGTFTDELTLSTSAGDVSVPMSGSAAQPPLMTITPMSLDFGKVPVSAATTASFTVSNTGGSTLTLTKSKPPVAGQGFTATTNLAEGTSIAPGAAVTETVKFAPTLTGAASDSWILTGNDSSGAQTITFTGTGSSAGSVPSPTAGGWTLNGSATLTGGGLQLTDSTTPSAKGSAFWPTPVDSSYLDVSFDAAIDSGGGADGMTLALADPSKGAVPTSLGVNGGGLGWARIPGVAVALDTYQNGTDPSNNFIGVASGFSATNNDNLIWQATSTAVPPLRNTVRHIRVLVTAGQLSVSVDGAQVLQTPVTMPPNTLIGFTGADGAITDRHAVSNVSITTIGPATAPGSATAVTATPGNGKATVTWTAPANDGGSPITSYSVTANPGGQTAVVTGTPPATTAALTGLSNGTAYTFTVTATNAIGTGSASVASAPVTPAAPPPPPPGLYVNDTVLDRPTSGTGQAMFTVTLSAVTSTPVSVTYETGDGTAKAGADYIALAPTTLTFAPGETTKTVPVTVNGSAAHGTGSLDFHLVLSAAQGATIADGDGRARLVNMQGPLSIYVGDTTVNQSATAATTAAFTLSLSAPTAAGESVTVAVATSDGSAASSDGDYTPLPTKTVTFGPGTQTAVVTVPVGAAAGPEANEVFNLNLATASANAVIGRNKAKATIVNGGTAPGPGLYVTDAVLAGPTTGTAQATFAVSLSGPAAVPVTVSYRTSDGAAKAGTDYVAVPATTLTFAPGETTKAVAVTVNGRSVHGSGSVDFHLLLSTASGASIADGDGKARIINTLGPLSIYIADISVSQSAGGPAVATFTLSLSAPTSAGESATVVVSTSDGTATSSDGDYSGLAPTTVTFAPNSQAVTVNVAIGAAAGPEPDEVFNLNLATASINAVIGRNKAKATIVNVG